MARIRTIKPEFWKHEDLSELAESTHMLAAALLNYADDEGYFNANPSLIKGECFPLREPSVSIHDSLTALSNIGYLTLGKTANGRTYGRINKFSSHQRVNRPSPSKIKDLDVVWEPSPTIHGEFTEPSLPEQGTGNREQGTGNMSVGAHTHNGSRSCFVPPDWQPDVILPGSVRLVEGVDVGFELEQFKLHEFAQPKSNWQNAWISWLNRAKPRHSTATSKQDATTEALQRFVNG